MALINPKNYKEVYGHQAELNEFKQPPTGTYDVVNAALQFQTVGEKKTKKLRIRAHVLRCIDGNGGEFVGKTFGFDLWWDLSKDMNLTRVALLGIAVTGEVEKEWDPENNQQLVENLTGRPYRITIKTEPTTYKGKTRDELTVQEVKSLTTDQRASYAKDPNWSKIVGKPAERMLEAKDYSAQAGGGSSGGGGQKTATSGGDPFRDDDILPS